MSIINALKMEIIKLRKTGFWILQLVWIIGVTFLLDGYFVLYSGRDVVSRVKLIYEFMGLLVPIFACITVAFLLKMEEQISSMYLLLGVQKRSRVMIAILILSWMGCVIQVAVQTISLLILGVRSPEMIKLLLVMNLGIIILSLFFYGFHIFLHLKFGIGISLFFGVFECMQMVMYSNIVLKGNFRFIPFAWIMEWKTGVLAGNIKEQSGFWIICLILLAFSLGLFFMWFEHWEGKKNYGE